MKPAMDMIRNRYITALPYGKYNTGKKCRHRIFKIGLVRKTKK